MQAEKTEKGSADVEEKLKIARKNLDDIMKEIGPFIKKRGVRLDSTSDRWMITSEQEQVQSNK
jgi:hypothetical protein